MAKKDSESFKDQNIKVSIAQSAPSNFYIEEYEDFDYKNIKVEDLDFRLEIKMAHNDKFDAVKIILELDTLLLNKDKKAEEKKVFGIKGSFVFSVPELKKAGYNGGVIELNPFTRKLLNISIGGLRGMASVYLTNTELSHIALPLFDLTKWDH